MTLTHDSPYVSIVFDMIFIDPFVSNALGANWLIEN